MKANSLKGDESKGVRKLIGDVGFEHENVQLFCDSAYLFTKLNNIHAYGHVHIKQGDTLNMYGDSLTYNGNERIAKLRHHIRVTDREMTLTTDYLDYDRNKNLAYYKKGGSIVNGKHNTRLTSQYGYYYPKTKNMHYKQNVILITPTYEIRSDTLIYNTRSEITYFLGPSYITSKENNIYCENGWYNTNTNQARFSRNVRIETGTKTIRADSIFYDRNNHTGQAFCNVSISDTSDDIIIYGDYALDNGKDSLSMATGNALLEQHLSNDTMYIHADTLLAGFDSSGRILRAFYHVKFFMDDIQGKCDSLTYSDSDSAIRMFRDPVLWSDENQMTADFIKVLKSNNKLHTMYMYDRAFIASEADTSHFNQISGKDMISHFQNNKLRKVDVLKQGQTIYFVKGDSGKYIGLNHANCQNLVIRIDSNKIRSVSFIGQPDAILYPMDQLSGVETRLKGFRWRNDIRPVNWQDIFFWDAIPVHLQHHSSSTETPSIKQRATPEKKDTGNIPEKPVQKNKKEKLKHNKRQAKE